MALANINVSSGGGGSNTPKLVAVPVQSGTLTYTGKAKSPTWEGYDSTLLTISGTNSATNAGTYTATFTPKKNCTWTDGTSNPKNVSWTIDKATNSFSATTSDSSLVYGDTATIKVTNNLSSGAITATSSNPAAVAVQSVTSSTITIKCVGVSSESTIITITVAEDANHLSASKTKSITTAKADGSVTLSATGGTVTYGTPLTFTVTSNVSGGELSVTSSNDTYATASISGNTVTVNCVKYFSASSPKITVTSAETANYKKATATFKATLARATCVLSLSAPSGVVTKSSTKTFTVATPSDGTLSVTSSDEEVATATISGTAVTVTGIGIGFATIIVSQKQSTNYEAPVSQTYSVQCRETKLITDSWATISTRSKNGTAANYYGIGDYKEITLNGKIGDCLTLTNETLRVFILHFNYPMDGTPENNIIWGGFKNADGIDVALCDSKYNNGLEDGTICFNMNHWGDVNYGGWKGCDLRYDILGATSTQPSEYNQLKSTTNVGYNATAETLTNPKENTLLAALPSDFRNVLRLWSRWVDAKGNKSNAEANIEETIDAVTLLTEFEVKGARSYANAYEKNHQTQMAYYRTSNSKIKYNHTSISSAVMWWVASPYYSYGTDFCCVYTDGSASRSHAFRAYGIAPAFKT